MEAAMSAAQLAMTFSAGPQARETEQMVPRVRTAESERPESSQRVSGTLHDDIVYLGWSDPDHKRAAADKITAAMDHYRAKFGQEPTIVLMHMEMAREVSEGWRLDVDGRPTYYVEATLSIPRDTVYVGWEER